MLSLNDKIDSHSQAHQREIEKSSSNGCADKIDPTEAKSLSLILEVKRSLEMSRKPSLSGQITENLQKSNITTDEVLSSRLGNETLFNVCDEPPKPIFCDRSTIENSKSPYEAVSS